MSTPRAAKYRTISVSRRRPRSQGESVEQFSGMNRTRAVRRGFLFCAMPASRGHRGDAMLAALLEPLVAVAPELRPLPCTGLAGSLHLFPFGAAFLAPLVEG